MLPKLRPFSRMKPRRKKQPGHMARVATMPCLVCGKSSEVHHVRTGHQAKDDARVVPLCPDHHRHSKLGFHGLGSERAFYQEYGINLSAEADRIATESRQMGILP